MNKKVLITSLIPSHLQLECMKKLLKYGLFLLFLISQSGCLYYKAQTRFNPGKADASWAQSNNKHFFIHTDTRVYDLVDVSVEDDTLRGFIGCEWTNYGFLEKMPYDGSYDSETKHLLNEVHLYGLYFSNPYLEPGTQVTIPYDVITEMNTYKSNPAKTWASIGITLVVVPLFIFESYCEVRDFLNGKEE